MTHTQSPTLQECLKEYTSEDTLDNDNKFICSNCSGQGQPLTLMVVYVASYIYTSSYSGFLLHTVQSWRVFQKVQRTKCISTNV